ncbi:MAG: hypothetical protein ACO1RX_07850 [Candidatus Sericytochromatia bacterium]
MENVTAKAICASILLLLNHLFAPAYLLANPIKLVTPVSLQQELSFTPLKTWKRESKDKSITYRHTQFPGRIEIGRIAYPNPTAPPNLSSRAQHFSQHQKRTECGYIPIASVVAGGYSLTQAQGGLLCSGFSTPSASLVELSITIPNKAIYRFLFTGPPQSQPTMLQEMSILAQTVLVFDLEYPPEPPVLSPLVFRTLKLGKTTQQEAWNYLKSRPREYSKLKQNHFAISGELWMAQKKHRFILFFHHAVFCEINILFEQGPLNSHYSDISYFLDQNYGKHSLNYVQVNKETICLSWLSEIRQPLELEKQWGADGRARKLCQHAPIVLGQAGYTIPLIYRLRPPKPLTMGDSRLGSHYLVFRDTNLTHLFVQDWLYQRFRQKQELEAHNRQLSEMF